jgi:ribosomal protein L28
MSKNSNTLRWFVPVVAKMSFLVSPNEQTIAHIVATSCLSQIPNQPAAANNTGMSLA